MSQNKSFDQCAKLLFSIAKSPEAFFIANPGLATKLGGAIKTLYDYGTE
jgi:hypothetical protein